MSNSGEKQSLLVDQDLAVEDYLSTLLDNSFDEKTSAERAADNIAGILGSVSSTEPELPVVSDNDTSEAVYVDDMEISKSVDESASEENSVRMEESQAASSDGQYSEPPLNIDYKDSSEDPDVIAEAEKMLSYVFPQPMAEENTPLRKLQEAGVIKVSQASNTNIEETISDTPVELVPDYASDRFTMMAFRVNNMKMLVSVTELLNVKKAEGKLQGLPGRPEWLYQYQKPEGGTGFIAHGGALCASDGETCSLEQDISNKYIVWMLNGRFGVLCDDVQEMVDINKRQVAWRGSKAHRPWCAGTIRSMKAVLLDAESLWQMIDGQL